MNQNNKFVIKYQNQIFPANPDLLCVKSKYFKQKYVDGSSSFPLEGDYQISSVETFIKALQGEGYHIKEENISDIINLSNSWGFEELNCEAKSLIQIPNDNISLIKKINEFHKKKISLNLLETELIKRFNFIIKEKTFYDLPNDFLLNVFEKISQNNLFEMDSYCESLLQLTLKYGESFSIFFKFIILDKLKPENLKQLLNSKFFNENFFSKQLFDISKSLIDNLLKENLELEKQISQAQAESSKKLDTSSNNQRNNNSKKINPHPNPQFGTYKPSQDKPKVDNPQPKPIDKPQPKPIDKPQPKPIDKPKPNNKQFEPYIPTKKSDQPSSSENISQQKPNNNDKFKPYTPNKQ